MKELLQEKYFFVMEDGDIRTHHIHIVKRNGTGWSNYISFRDYLNANPEKAMMYDEFKREISSAVCRRPEALYRKQTRNHRPTVVGSQYVEIAIGK